MKTGISTEQARAFLDRWRLVNAAERDELRNTSMERKLDQLAALMASAVELGWDEQLAKEDEAVRTRWNRLRRARSG